MSEDVLVSEVVPVPEAALVSVAALVEELEPELSMLRSEEVSELLTLSMVDMVSSFIYSARFPMHFLDHKPHGPASKDL
jgi:hypothetical protein